MEIHDVKNLIHHDLVILGGPLRALGIVPHKAACPSCDDSTQTWSFLASLPNAETTLHRKG